MSAFAALKGKKSIKHIFNDESKVADVINEQSDGMYTESPEHQVEEEEKEEIYYEQCSSGSEFEAEVNRDPDIFSIRSVDEDDAEKTTMTYEPSSHVPKEPLFHTDFTLSKRNSTLLSDNKIIIGLSDSQNLVICGQFRLSILKGAVLLNDHHILEQQDIKFEIIAPQSQGLMTITCTGSDNEISKMYDSQFNYEAFKSVIQLESLTTGLQEIGRSYPIYKNLFELLSCESDQLNLLKNHSYSIVEKSIGVQALRIDPYWSQVINEIVSESQNTPQITVIIGNKNTGKSTFAKTLLDTYVLKGQKISYLDIDPGQSEFSTPGTLSLTSVKQPILGYNLNTQNDVNAKNPTICHFYGFNSPAVQPKDYLKIIASLCENFNQKTNPGSLIVNTPGWIKGFGKEVLKELTTLIKCDNLVLLSPHPNADEPENHETLHSVSFRTLKICKSMDISSKYSAAQLRDLNKIIYFRWKDTHTFDFKNHLLSTPPMKLSFETSDSPKDLVGVNAICLLKGAIGDSLDHNDLSVILEASLMGAYVVETTVWNSQLSLNTTQIYPNCPRILDQTTYKDLVRNQGTERTIFMGLVIIHSVNQSQNYFNVYTPSSVSKNIKKRIHNGSYKLLLVKGDEEIAAPEFYNPTILLNHEKQAKAINQNNKNGLNSEQTDTIYKIPYVSFETKKQIGGVWKLRRGLKRKR